MTNIKAIRLIKDHMQVHHMGEYPHIYIAEALNMAIEALEKQIPIEHHHTRINKINDEVRVSVCPSCLCLNYTYKDELPKFCNSCGQAISWK